MEKHQNMRETTAAVALLQFQETVATRLLRSEMLQALELLDSETSRAAELRIKHMLLLSKAEDHRQLMGWMSGQYSVDSSIGDVNAERDFDIGALDLKLLRATKALHLKSSHKQVASELKEFHRMQASELKNIQRLSLHTK